MRDVMAPRGEAGVSARETPRRDVPPRCRAEMSRRDVAEIRLLHRGLQKLGALPEEPILDSQVLELLHHRLVVRRRDLGAFLGPSGDCRAEHATNRRRLSAARRRWVRGAPPVATAAPARAACASRDERCRRRARARGRRAACCRFDGRGRLDRVRACARAGRAGLPSRGGVVGAHGLSLARLRRGGGRRGDHARQRAHVAQHLRLFAVVAPVREHHARRRVDLAALEHTERGDADAHSRRASQRQRRALTRRVRRAAVWCAAGRPRQHRVALGHELAHELDVHDERRVLVKSLLPQRLRRARIVPRVVGPRARAAGVAGCLLRHRERRARRATWQCAQTRFPYEAGRVRLLRACRVPFRALLHRRG